MHPMIIYVSSRVKQYRMNKLKLKFSFSEVIYNSVHYISSLDSLQPLLQLLETQHLTINLLKCISLSKLKEMLVVCWCAAPGAEG